MKDIYSLYFVAQRFISVHILGFSLLNPGVPILAMTFFLSTSSQQDMSQCFAAMPMHYNTVGIVTQAERQFNYSREQNPSIPTVFLDEQLIENGRLLFIVEGKKDPDRTSVT